MSLHIKSFRDLKKLTTFFFATLFLSSGAFADEIQVITSGAFAEALVALAPIYEKQSQNKVIISNGSSMGSAPDSIPSRLARGERFDILILAAPALDAFIKSGEVQAGTKVDLVASVIGAAVRKGATKPDISTVGALKNTLLAAKSVAYSASASGTYLSTVLFPQLGIADQMQLTAKKIYSERVGTVIARGEADLGFQQVSELIPIAGIDLLGELPAEVQQTVLFSAGITSSRNNLNAARDLIAFLASKQVAPMIAQAGLKPILSPLPW